MGLLQSTLLTLETKLPIKGSYTTGSKTWDESIASFLDLLPGDQMASLYPFGTVEDKREISKFWPNDYFHSFSGYSVDNYQLHGRAFTESIDKDNGNKYFFGVNSDNFVVRS